VIEESLGLVAVAACGAVALGAEVAVAVDDGVGIDVGLF
jgi:hypothetical protein